jgi:hypothetical protein
MTPGLLLSQHKFICISTCNVRLTRDQVFAEGQVEDIYWLSMQDQAHLSCPVLVMARMNY